MSAPALLLRWLLFCLCGIFLSRGTARGALHDVSLSVEPGWLAIRNVPVGQHYEVEARTRIPFKIHNGSNKPRRYRLKADKPDAVGVKVLKGYAGIPDPAWFWFETNEVAVPANGEGQTRMFLRIPDDEQYCNQKWAVGIGVEAMPEAGESLVLAVSPVFYIETESRAEVRKQPAGVLGVAPATILFDCAVNGTNRMLAPLHVYNNDNRPHLYRINTVVPSAEPGRQVITPTPGFSWAPMAEWIVPGTRILKIGPHAQETIFLSVDMPTTTGIRNQRWEGLIFIESEAGTSTFVRGQIRFPKD